MGQQKLHRSLVMAVINALTEIFTHHRYADRVVERALTADRRFGARDRAFIAEHIYDILRRWRWLGYISNTPDNDAAPRVAAWLAMQEFDAPEYLASVWPNEATLANKIKDANAIRVVRESIPDWLDELAVTQLGEECWTKEIAALNIQAPVVVRTNTLKTTNEKLIALFAEKEIPIKQLTETPNAIEVLKRGNLFAHDEFKTGLFELQDTSSQLVGELLNPQPGMRVIDACAGAGGKTLHLAALMQNKGKIIALDVEQKKLDELRKRASRAGATLIESKLIENSKTIKRLANSTDRLLLDAPCSGLGVLRRNPDAKWKLTPEFITQVQQTQAEILSAYSTMLKPGGLMVYATCSILPTENNLQVERFLTENPNYKLLEDKTLWPSTFGYDGFYMALIEKTQ